MVCPSRLYLKLSGFGSEVQRAYTPPSVSPNVVGKIGEKSVSSGYLRQPKLVVPQVRKRQVRYPRTGLEKFVSTMSTIVKNNIDITFAQCSGVTAGYLPDTMSDIGKELKKKFGVVAVIEGVNYTTVPHHYVGRIDFLGLKEDNEVVILEVKNKSERLDNRDSLQLEYYMAGLPKQHQFTKIQEHILELIPQLYPEKYLNYLLYAKKLSIMKREWSNLHAIIVQGLDSLGEGDRKKFTEKYYSKDNVRLRRTSASNDFATDTMLEETLVKTGAVDGFLNVFPEATQLIRTVKEYTAKMSVCEKDFDETTQFVSDMMSRGIRNGLLIDVRRGEIRDTGLTTDFDIVAKGIWSVKRNVLMGKKVSMKNRASCSYCQYKKACARLVKEETEFEPTTSITSVAHRGFSNLEYNHYPPSERLSLLKEEIKFVRHSPSVVFYDKKLGAFRNFSNEEILEPVLSKSAWGYQEWFAQRRGWKSLFADAVVSKKLGLEFDFWRI